MMTPEADIVARTAWGEARNTGRDGMHAVINVIANRVHNPRWWGQDWTGVCQQPAQFSCWNLDDPNRPKMLSVTDNDRVFRIALDLAQQAIDGTLPDVTGHADHYYATASPEPYWAKAGTRTLVDEWHSFYRLELSVPDSPSPKEPPAMLPQINNGTTQGTAGLAAGAAGALSVLFSGVLQHYGLLLTPDQTSALVVILTTVLHPIGVLLFGGISKNTTP